jgi:TonB family protein
MPFNKPIEGLTLGLLPEPEGRTRSFVTSMVVNGLLLCLVLAIGMMAKRVIETRVEQAVLLIPDTPPPPKLKLTPPPKIKMPDPVVPEVKLAAPKILMPKLEPKPEKPIQMEAKIALPAMRAAKPAVILAPQPKSALSAAAMPAQAPGKKPSTAPVHLGQTFGVTPNPNATRPATIAAIGNPYGGMNGPSVAPHGVVGSTGFGNGTRSGSNAGVVGRVASAGIPGASGNAHTTSPGNVGRVASAGIPTMQAAAPTQQMRSAPASTNLEVLSKPAVQYTSEAKQLKVQGDVVLRVTFTAAGHVVVQGIIHGLGHGLDEEARRVAQQIRFHPATRNGQSVDTTTNITISFQLA